ncbi:hypothetical protein GYB61_04680 [bacterium]|nr:hypothetical protein [bacterium]
METRINLPIIAQPDDVTCGPTCLQAIYGYYGDNCNVAGLTEEIRMLPGGGTLDVFLANHALRRGYAVRILTYNLSVFDPTWFQVPGPDLAERLRAQAETKLDDARLQVATTGYLEFLRLGGEIVFEDLTATLIRRLMDDGTPVLTGLSATYLYRMIREVPGSTEDDDLRGEPAGHFVVLCGYDPGAREVLLADPYADNPIGGQIYAVRASRLIGAILLGVLTYDANLLVITPR